MATRVSLILRIGFALLTVSGTLLAQITAMPSSLAFGDQQVGSLSPAQTAYVTYTARSYSYAITGRDAADFRWAYTNTPVPQVTVTFWPRFPGMKSASLTVTDTSTNSSVAIPLTGNAAMSGTFHIFASFSAKVLDLASPSASDGTSIVQNAVDGTAQQGWKFIPTGDGYYEIVNSASGKVLDVTGASTQDGTTIQQYTYLGGSNQQWRVAPVDDAHFQIVNRLSGKSLDVTGGSNLDGTPIQQWSYQGEGQQLWAIIPANPYLIGNPYGKVLDVLDGATANQALIQQWSSNGNRQQQWELVPEKGGFYVIVNRLTSKVLDNTQSSTSQGTLIQQYDYLEAANQLWTLVPEIPDGVHGLPQENGLAYFITNKASGLALDVSRSYSNGTLIQQALNGTPWELAPIGTYLIQNAFSNLVLDVPGGSEADGNVVQQWASNGNLQQQWQVVPLPFYVQVDQAFFLATLPGSAIFVNRLTGKALDVAGRSTSDLAEIVQSDPNGLPSQTWQLGALQDTPNFSLINLNSLKALDDTNASNSDGNLMEQYGYLGGLNQQWQFVSQ